MNTVTKYCDRIEDSVEFVNERFWSKVDKSAGIDGCWMWTAYKNKKGYGIFSTPKGNVLAHRASFYFSKPESDKNLCVCHTCDNPSCVNPKHLWIGTHLDNSNDKIKKKRDRHACGEQHGFCKLTKEQVREIKILRAGGTPLKELAFKYGVTFGLIGHIANGRIWRQ